MSFKLLPNVNLQRSTPLEECSSVATLLTRTILNGSKAALLGVSKKSGVKATISLLDETSAN